MVTAGQFAKDGFATVISGAYNQAGKGIRGIVQASGELKDPRSMAFTWGLTQTPLVAPRQRIALYSLKRRAGPSTRYQTHREAIADLSG